MEMDIGTILTFLGGLSISVIGYFLKQTMGEIRNIKEITYTTKTKVEVMEADYINKISNLNEKFDLLYTAINKLTDKIEKLNDKIK
jgi:hypothetical protein